MASKPRPRKGKKLSDFQFLVIYDGEVLLEGNDRKDIPFFDPTFKESRVVTFRSYNILPTDDDSQSEIIVTGPDLAYARKINVDLSSFWDDDSHEPDSVEIIGNSIEFRTPEDPLRSSINVEPVDVRRSKHLSDEELRDLALDHVKYVKDMRRAHVAAIRGRSNWETGQGKGAILTGAGEILEAFASVLGPFSEITIGVLSLIGSILQGIVTVIVHTLGGSTQLGSALLNFLFGTVNVVGHLLIRLVEVALRLLMLPFQLLINFFTVWSNWSVNHRHAESQRLAALYDADSRRDVAYMETGGCIGRVFSLIFSILLVIFVLAMLV